MRLLQNIVVSERMAAVTGLGAWAVFEYRCANI
jgi:hypothetical protein